MKRAAAATNRHQANPARHTIFLLDDHEVTRRGIAALLGADPGLDVVGQAGTATEGLEQLRELQPDVALLDVVLPDGSGIDVCRQVRAQHPQVRCLMLTAHDEGEAFFAAVMGGASGFLTKHADQALLIHTVRKAAEGSELLEPKLVGKLVDQLRTTASQSPGAALTSRQQQLLDRVVAGCTNDQIAVQLGLREQTVRAEISLIFAKTGLQRTMEAAKGGGRPWFDQEAHAKLTFHHQVRTHLSP